MNEAAPAGISALTTRELAARITELTGHLNAATHRWLVLLAESDRRHGWSDGYTKSFAHWLNWKCGIDLGAAREKVRVARALESLPKISEAMSTGRLSYSKVRALTRVATPETEPVLLNVALHGTAHHVEKLVRQFRRVQEVEELSREARQQTRRGVRYSYDQDGSLLLKVHLPADAGASVLKALAAALPEAPPGTADSQDSRHVSAATSPPYFRLPRDRGDLRRADAQCSIVETMLAAGAGLKAAEKDGFAVPLERTIVVGVPKRT